MFPGPPSKTKRNANIKFILFGFALVVAFMWLLYLLRAGFDVDLISHSGQQDKVPTATYLGLAIAATVICFIWATVLVRKQRDLASRGRSTTGTVTSTSALQKRGFSPTTISFEVDGKPYKVRKDLRRTYVVGQTVQIVYDPDNPKSCEIDP